MLLRSGAGSYWTGFLSGTKYKFWTEGNGTSGPNRELETRWKDPWCMIRVAASYPGRPLALHDVQWKPLTFGTKRNRAEN
jgi:hypothetical protein